MTISRIINMMAGMMIIFSVLLAHMSGTIDITQPSWLWFTLFVGANLFQFSFTGFCPLDTILRKMGVKDGSSSCSSGNCAS